MISRFQADLVIVKFLQKVIIWAQNTTAKTHLGFRQTDSENRVLNDYNA